MFLCGRKKTLVRKTAFAALILLFIAGPLFTSCTNPMGERGGVPVVVPIAVPAGLQGIWLSNDGERITITTTALNYEIPPFGSYGGEIVNHRTAGPGAGYITIRVDRNDYNPEALGTYYVLHYKNLGASAMEISGALPDMLITTRQEAEATYMTGNAPNYFLRYSPVVTLATSEKTPEKLRGTWVGETINDMTYTFEITEDTIVLTSLMEMWGMEFPSNHFTSAVQNVRTGVYGPGTGYMTLNFAVVQAHAHQGRYGILHWREYTENGQTMVQITVSTSSAAGWANQSRATPEEAEADFFWVADIAVPGGGFLSNVGQNPTGSPFAGNQAATLITFTRQ